MAAMKQAPILTPSGRSRRCPRRVDEHEGDGRNATVSQRWPARAGGEGDGDGSRGHQHQHAGGVGAALGVDVGIEDPGDEERGAGQDEHQRADGAGPLRRHAVAGQVAGDQVEHARPSPRRRRTTGSGWSRRRRRCRRRRPGTGAPGRPAPGRWRAAVLELLRRDQQRRHQARGDEVDAHDAGGHRQQPLGVADPAGGTLGGRRRCRPRRGSSPRLRSRSRTCRARAWGTGERDRDHQRDVAVLRGQRAGPVGDHVAVLDARGPRPPR